MREPSGQVNRVSWDSFWNLGDRISSAIARAEAEFYSRWIWDLEACLGP